MTALNPITVIGAGLAGTEAAWQIAGRNIPVRLVEMRPLESTPAHQSGNAAELVCSNSLGSRLPDRPTGLLQEELRRLGSVLLQVAEATAVPAGGALAVDRDRFADLATKRLQAHPLVRFEQRRVDTLPQSGICIVATGPLTAPALARSLSDRVGAPSLYFYDAMAPIVSLESLDLSVCFRASRYDRGAQPEGDYLNCPMTREEYERFVAELTNADQAQLRDFEREDRRFFEACLPVEELARRGRDTLAFGPLRPKGLTPPGWERRPYAVVQLRQDNAAGSLYNLVGFQTNLTHAEQDRVFRTIPGLQNARFVRYGQMHRNTFLNAPRLLDSLLRLKSCPRILMAGQLIGAEGYVGSVATGYLAGVEAARMLRGQPPFLPPRETMLGALVRYLTCAAPGTFQPMKANFGLMPPLNPPVKGKRARQTAYSRRALVRLACSETFCESAYTVCVEPHANQGSERAQ